GLDGKGSSDSTSPSRLPLLGESDSRHGAGCAEPAQRADEGVLPRGTTQTAPGNEVRPHQSPPRRCGPPSPAPALPTRPRSPDRDAAGPLTATRNLVRPSSLG